MTAFTNPNFPRDQIFAEIQKSHAAGLLRQGEYFDKATGAGTIVGVLMKGEAPRDAVDRFGMPQPFVFALDVIFSGLPREAAAPWGIAFLEKVTQKKDLSRVWARMAAAPLKKLEQYVSGERLKVLTAAIDYVERRAKPEHDLQEQQDFLNIKATWDLIKEEEETLYIIKSAVLSTRPVNQIAAAAAVADEQARALDAAAALRYTAKFIAARAQQATFESTEDASAALLAAGNASDEVYMEFAARFTTIVTEAPESKVSLAQRVASVASQRPMNWLEKKIDGMLPQEPRDPNPPLPTKGPWG
jgi:hypothetical protein